MELLATDIYFILVDGEHSLWINRQNVTYTAKSGPECLNSVNAVSLGTVYGFFGKLHFSENVEPRLVFIRQRSFAACLRGHDVYKIISVVSIPVESEAEILLEPYNKNSEYKRKINDNGTPSATASSGGTPTEPSSGRQLVKVKTLGMTSRPGGQRKSEKLDKVERRILDDFHKMFTEADSFYYSTEYDITNAVQRQVGSWEQSIISLAPLWQRADVRFFWNHYMMQELINMKQPEMDRWIVPVMQGFIQFGPCEVEHLFDSIGPEEMLRVHIDLCVISRRSRFRAGTRYLRRGVDENGKVANYVETEQILVYAGHMISFVQTRGSIPIFWSQPGFRYRPTPQLQRSEEENFEAFGKHFEEEKSIYGPVVIVNLVEKAGKEKILGDTFLENVLKYDSSDIVYVSFDFHESCRGMKFENVSVLIDNMESVIKSLNYCWVDSYGTVLTQTGVVRVNCIDCLDRTNVVQTHLAKHMLCAQLSKLGLVAPEVGLPDNVKVVLQTIWANNGDTISKQYAGTNALKGDYTRTGERKITGVMKDGMNSANRYYLNRFKDASRLAVIELMLGIRKNFTEADFDAEKTQEEKENTTEQIKMVIDDVKKRVIPSNDIILGAWGLINGRTNEPDAIDIDTIFILTERRYFVTEYDCTMDSITDTQKVGLLSVESIELGFDALVQPSNFLRLFHHDQNATHAAAVPNMRLNYRFGGEINFHQFRSSTIRFFNNVAIPIHHPDEMLEGLSVIAEAIKIAVLAQGNEIPVILTALPVKVANRSGLPAIASSFVHKYFTTVQASEESDQPAKKFAAVSLERFTPKYFRRSSAAVSEKTTGESSKTTNVSSGSTDVRKQEPNFSDDKTEVGKIGASPLHPQPLPISSFTNLIGINAITPVEVHSINVLHTVKDLVLPSCGILVLPQRRPISSLLLSTGPELSLGIDDSRRDQQDMAALSPMTPMSDTLPQLQDTPLSNQSTIASFRSTNDILQRHRHSLPANSLGFGSTSPNTGPRGSVTPEITITEEPSGEDGGKNLLGAGISMAKRISRSSEDVNSMVSCKNTSVISLVGPNTIQGGLGLRLRNLAPIIKNENRSTSDQNIFGSLVNMKGSHSESALRDTPFQQSGSQKKDMVLAPLGKLARGMQNIGANYLDPRKIRDTFKQPRNETAKKESNPESQILMERKRNCKSQIIDL